MVVRRGFIMVALEAYFMFSKNFWKIFGLKGKLLFTEMCLFAIITSSYFAFPVYFS